MTYYGCPDTGYVLRGVKSVGGRVLLADNSGRLLNNSGWVEFKEGQDPNIPAGKYYLDRVPGKNYSFARTGEQTIDGRKCVFAPDGRYGEAGSLVAWLAEQCNGNSDYYTPHAWNRPTQPDMQKYARVFDATVVRMGGNTAYGSCTQAASAMAAAVVDIDAAKVENNGGPESFGRYLQGHPDLYRNMGRLGIDQCQPGDFLHMCHHDAIFIGKIDDDHIKIWYANYLNGPGRYPHTFTYTRADYDWFGFTAYRPIAPGDTGVDYRALVR